MQPYGSGHINRTYLVVTAAAPAYILQRINTNVFKQPEIIATNQRLTGDYLARTAPDYVFPQPVRTVSGDEHAY